MKNWYELGKKIGHIDLMAQVNRAPLGCASPHDIENEYYEIIDTIKKMGFDESLLSDANIDEYFMEIIRKEIPVFTNEKRLYFQIGFYFMKIKTILECELEDIVTDSKVELLEELKEKAKNLPLFKYVNNLSLDVYRKDIFDKIEIEIYSKSSSNSNSPSFPIKKTEIHINTLTNNGNLIMGDANDSSFLIDHHIEKIEGEIEKIGGVDRIELEKAFEEVKSLIKNMNESREIPEQKSIFKKISKHFSNYEWFYSEIVNLMGQVIINLINS